MRTGTHTDETGQEHTQIVLETGDLLTTGHSSSGPNHTTFHTEARTSFTVRNLDGDEAFELSNVLVCVSVLSICIATVEITGIPAVKNVIVVLLLCFSLVVLTKRAVDKEDRAGREILFLLATGGMLVGPDSGILLLAFGALCLFLAVHYAWLWKRAIWEPIAAFLPFSVGMIFYEMGAMPSWLVLSLFPALAVFGCIGFIRIHLNAFQYDGGYNRLGE
ncbi:MAG: hypothetical protein V4682_01300 [Patescibacteria group bacterium]